MPVLVMLLNFESFSNNRSQLEIKRCMESPFYVNMGVDFKKSSLIYLETQVKIAIWADFSLVIFGQK